MKTIILTQNKVALVDDADYEWLNQWKWYAQKGRYTFYACRKIKKKGKWKLLQMHRLIMNAKKGQMVDHENGNGLDNQRDNLRFCTHGQNMANRKSSGISKYLGVNWHKRDKRWQVHITTNKRNIPLGYYKDEKEAARIYNKAALKHHGEFANLNLI